MNFNKPNPLFVLPESTRNITPEDLPDPVQLPRIMLRMLRELALSYPLPTVTVTRLEGHLESAELEAARQQDRNDNSARDLPDYYGISSEFAEYILEDFLEIRRAIVIHLLIHSRRKLLSRVGEIRSVLVQLRNVRKIGLEALVEANLASCRVVIDAVDQPVLDIVFNTIEPLIRDLPVLAESLFYNPENIRNLFSDFVRILFSDKSNEYKTELMDRILLNADEQSIETFRYLLARHAVDSTSHNSKPETQINEETGTGNRLC